MSREYLDTYLNDHLLGSVAALDILDQLIKESVELRPVLENLRRDIESDQQEIVHIMRHLDIAESRVRKASGWVAGQIAEAKFVLDDEEGGRLRRLERLEALVLGVQGKLRLWQALDAASRVDTQLGVIDYQRLMDRAQSQQAQLEALRLDAARSALTIAA